MEKWKTFCYLLSDHHTKTEIEAEVREHVGKTLFVYKQFVETNYNDPLRYYHTLDHILSCITRLEKLCEREPARARPPVGRWSVTLTRHGAAEIEAAIWFHDIIYDARRNDNEEKSADLAKLILITFDMPGNFIKKVCNMIMLSGKHLEDNTELTVDEKFFLDIDLSILGETTNIYDLYTKQIRKEYSFVEDNIFCYERKKILDGFLEKKNIYYTEYFRENFQDKAIENLTRRQIY